MTLESSAWPILLSISHVSLLTSFTVTDSYSVH